jgi:hypothetical protein
MSVATIRAIVHMKTESLSELSTNRIDFGAPPSASAINTNRRKTRKIARSRINGITEHSAMMTLPGVVIYGA